MTPALGQTRHGAEEQFPVLMRIAVPWEGLGRQLEIIHAWFDESCGIEGWARAPAGLASVVNNGTAFYFADAIFASAVLARFCCGYRAETIEDAFAIWGDAPEGPGTAPGPETF